MGNGSSTGLAGHGAPRVPAIVRLEGATLHRAVRRPWPDAARGPQRMNVLGALAPWLDPLALLLSAAILLGYRAWAHARERRTPGLLVHALNARVRERWVETVMASGRMDVLAVQTLRNSVMAASFMASTAVLLIIGTFTLTGNIDALSRFWVHGGEHASRWTTLKIGALVVDFSLAFFQFSMAIRFFNHVGYMINIAPERRDADAQPASVVAMLNRAGGHYSSGLRLFFFCLPLGLWLLGPAWLVLGTVGLVAALWRLDHQPGSGA